MQHSLTNHPERMLACCHILLHTISSAGAAALLPPVKVGCAAPLQGQSISSRPAFTVMRTAVIQASSFLTYIRSMCMRRFPLGIGTCHAHAAAQQLPNNTLTRTTLDLSLVQQAAADIDQTYSQQRQTAQVPSNFSQTRSRVGFTTAQPAGACRRLQCTLSRPAT